MCRRWWSISAKLPGVAYAEHNLYTCSQDTQERIANQIREHGLNRVVVASCTPRTHEPLFQDTLRQAGLNPHLFEMANIREQDSWVHRNKPETATEKAEQLARMAVAKARKLRPITRNMFEVDRKALVIGGGLAGMTAALSIARQGYAVYLVEREAELGGNLRHILIGEEGSHPQELLSQTIAAVEGEPRIQVLTGSQVTGISGYPGHYAQHRPRTGWAELGVPARGDPGSHRCADRSRQHEYLYGQHERVLTQRELETRLAGTRFCRQPGRADTGHDPVRRLARGRPPLLLAGLLHRGAQECAGDQTPGAGRTDRRGCIATCAATASASRSTARRARRG